MWVCSPYKFPKYSKFVILGYRLLSCNFTGRDDTGNDTADDTEFQPIIKHLEKNSQSEMVCSFFTMNAEGVRSARIKLKERNMRN